MFTLPDLPYDFKALEPFIDEETMHLHHDKHHQTYIDKLNTALADHPQLNTLSIEDLLQTKIETPELVKPIKNNGGGHFNHSMFWQIMAPADSPEVKDGLDQKLLDAINVSFGDIDTFKANFSDVALGHFGSGWAWLIKGENKLEIIDTSNQDNPLMEGKLPILGLDVWEHAYYLKYKNVRADYIKAWWNVVNWKKVSENFNNL